MKKYAIVKPDGVVMFIGEEGINVLIAEEDQTAYEAIYYMNNMYGYYLKLHIENCEGTEKGREFIGNRKEEIDEVFEGIDETNKLLDTLIPEEKRKTIIGDGIKAASLKFLKCATGQDH